jgi:hypothetical protein
MGVIDPLIVISKKKNVMKNKADVLTTTNNYLKQFYVAQLNLNRLIYEERLQKRVQNKRYLFKLQWVDQSALPL